MDLDHLVVMKITCAISRFRGSSAAISGGVAAHERLGGPSSDVVRQVEPNGTGRRRPVPFWQRVRALEAAVVASVRARVGDVKYLPSLPQYASSHATRLSPVGSRREGSRNPHGVFHSTSRSRGR